MKKSLVKCRNCHQEILQSNPNQCPYCGSKEFLSEEEVALMDQEVLESATVESITLRCPYCGEKQSITSSVEEIVCRKCNKKYQVPDNVREFF